MKKAIYIALLVTCVIGLSSCRGSSGQKAVKLAKEYLGKTVSGAKKSHLERYADDVARVKFTKVSCASCAGTGYVGYPLVTTVMVMGGFIRYKGDSEVFL